MSTKSSGAGSKASCVGSIDDEIPLLPGVMDGLHRMLYLYILHYYTSTACLDITTICIADEILHVAKSAC